MWLDESKVPRGTDEGNDAAWEFSAAAGLSAGQMGTAVAAWEPVFLRAASDGPLSTVPQNPALQRPSVFVDGSGCRSGDPAGCVIATFGTLAAFSRAHNLSELTPGSFGGPQAGQCGGNQGQKRAGCVHL